MLVYLSASCFLLGLKRKLESISCFALATLFILCFLVNSSQAGVLKKRDTNITETPNGNTVLKSKETEPEQANASAATFSTRLQTVADSNLAVETSKEFSNNEILLNEAKSILTESETADQISAKRNIEIEKTNASDSFQDLQHISKHIDSKEKPATDSKELNNNDIKEEKLQKFSEKPFENSKQQANTARDKENVSILVNKSEVPNVSVNLKSPNKSEDGSPIQHHKNEQHNSISASKLLTAPTQPPITISNSENKPLDNSIENSKEKEDLKLKNKVATLSMQENSELTTSKALANNEEKLLESSADFVQNKVEESPQISTSVPKATESLEALNNNSIVPFKDSDSGKQSQPFDIISIPQNQTKPNAETWALINPNPRFSPDKTTSGPITREDLLVFEGDKKAYIRSMSEEEITALRSAGEDEKLAKLEQTTLKPIKLSIKEGIPELRKAETTDQHLTNTKNGTLNIKEKKPKFINDNSTNAQQLNLPNNAEVWSLAAMKSLPKSNITMETTTHAHNETFKELNAEQNTSTTMNNNSEKSLLDWSQIMMDKELSSTTRNEDPEAIEGNEKETLLTETSTFTAVTENTQTTRKQPDEAVITINSLTPSTSLPLFTTTLLPPANDNENLSLADKKVEENMNNHIEALTANFASTNVDINPFNTSLNIEPKTDLNNVHTTTITTTAISSEEHMADDDIKANVYIQGETSTAAAAATPATTMSTLSTTAVHYDMTTV